MSRGRPKLGQHFLRDARYADRAVAAAKLVPDDIILEVGPGTGVLTRRLLATGARVIAVELDEQLADGIARDLPRVELIRGDAVQVELPRFSACVSNLPYQISSPFLFRLLGEGGFGGNPRVGVSPQPAAVTPQTAGAILPWRVAVLLLQKEFADRLVAKPGSGDYGRLTVNASRRADVKILTKVPPGAFDPPPRVESALVVLTPRAPGFDVPSNFDEVVERAFAQRRKKLSNSLGRKDIPHANRRPEELTPAEFAEVCVALQGR